MTELQLGKRIMPTTPIVAIKCLVYNHEPYLRKCLEGFVMQQTDFPFVAIVHDDASTDCSSDIIREYATKYPDIIKPIFETDNQYSKRDDSLMNIVNNATIATGAEYIALCEGDDYWIDPHKLQKQVDFLRNNSDYAMVHTDRYIQFGTDSAMHHQPYLNRGEENRASLLKVCSVTTCTVLIRARVYWIVESVLRAICGQNNLPMGDYPLWMLIAEQGRIGFLPDICSVYRMLPESASHSDNPKKRYQFDNGVVVCKEVFFKRYQAAGLATKNFTKDFYEMIFHLRKRMLFDYGWTARKQIIPLLCLFPYYPMILLRALKRKLRKA